MIEAHATPGLSYEAGGLLGVFAFFQVGDQYVRVFSGVAIATARPIPLSPRLITAALSVKRPWPR